MERVIFWNNKGGTGKTTLAFQLINEYAFKNKNKRILVIDVCPQANLSELLLGGLNQGGSTKLYRIKVDFAGLSDEMSLKKSVFKY